MGTTCFEQKLLNIQEHCFLGSDMYVIPEAASRI